MNILKMLSLSLIATSILHTSVIAFADGPDKEQQNTNSVDPEKFHRRRETRYILMSFEGQDCVKVYLQAEKNDKNEELRHSISDFALTFFKIKGIEELSVRAGSSYSSEQNYNYFHNGRLVNNIYEHIRNLGINYGDVISVLPKPQTDLDYRSSRSKKKINDSKEDMRLRLLYRDKAVEKLTKSTSKNEDKLLKRFLELNIKQQPEKLEDVTIISSPNTSNSQPNTEALPILW